MNNMLLTDEDQKFITMLALRFGDLNVIYEKWRELGTKRYQTRQNIDRKKYPVLTDEEILILKKVQYCNLQCMPTYSPSEFLD